jgi:hypothetical protein
MNPHPGAKLPIFGEAVAKFLDSADWLDESHLPSIVALQALAFELDKEVTAALVAQFGLIHRSLLKAKPSDDAPVNPFEELLRRDV